MTAQKRYLVTKLASFLYFYAIQEEFVHLRLGVFFGILNLHLYYQNGFTISWLWTVMAVRVCV